MHAEFDWTELNDREYYIYNSAIHARVVDSGRQYDELPNLTSLIPWVQDNLQDWHPFEYNKEDESETVDTDTGGGLDALAAQVGTVTESQETENSSLRGDPQEIVNEREPYDDSVFGVYTNGEQSNPTPFSYSLSKDIDYRDNKEIEVNQFKSSYTHNALSADQQQKIIERLKSEFGDENVQNVLDDLYQWKKGTYSQEATRFEKLVKEKYDVDAPVRLPDEFDAETPNKAMQNAYHEMGIISSEFLNKFFADDKGKVTAYRGFRQEQVAELGAKIFSNPDDNNYRFDDSVIQNYTTAESVASGFATGLQIEITFDVNEHLLLAPDFVFWDSIDTSNRDAELNLIGGQRQFSRDQLSASGVDVDVLTEKSLDKITVTEHQAIQSLVNTMYKQEALVSNPDMSKRLTDWVEQYKSDVKSNTDIGEKVDAITADVNPETDDSTLNFAQLTGSDITPDNNPLEKGDIAKTDFGTFRVQDPDTITAGWQGNEDYLLQPATDSTWDIYALPPGDESPVHLGKTEFNYARPSSDDPVFGYWLEEENGAEKTHIYHESDAPDEIKTTFFPSDTIDKDDWMDDRVGGTFLILTSDGTVVLATLVKSGGEYEFVKQDGSQISMDWYPPSSDQYGDSEARIVGVPNESN
jgi:hypothetical protein